MTETSPGVPSAQPRANRFRKGIFAPLGGLFDSRELVFYLTRQRIVLRYRDSFLGPAWILLAPALMLAVYTFVFGFIFEPRWSREVGSTTGTAEYSLLLYLGLCAYWFVSECIAEAPDLVSNHAHYVKKVVFPLESLAWISIGTALFNAFVRLLIFAAALLLLQGRCPATILLLPLAWLPLLFIALAFSWSLAALGVFVRDLGEIMNLLLTAMLFLSPVFYPIDSVPESFRWLVQMNPVTLPIEQIRDVAFFGKLPSVAVWTTSMIFSYLLALLGLALFARGRKAFADVV